MSDVDLLNQRMKDAQTRFIDAVAEMPDVAERLKAGAQFNEYELTTGEVAVCLGPITGRPLSLVTMHNADVAELLTAALRLASTLCIASGADGRGPVAASADEAASGSASS